jgi:Flp pilus assembly protein TadG
VICCGSFRAAIFALRGLPRADRSGSIVVLTALSLILLVGAAAMALDLAKLYLARSTAQRIADQSALAAAFAYGQSGDSEAAARSAAASLALANGAGDAAISTDIVASPSQNGNKAAWVVVTSPVPLSPFGQIGAGAASAATGAMSVNVSAAAYAEIQGNVAPCVVALGAYGIVSSDGTSLTATGCAVASAGSVTASNAPGITAQAVYAEASCSLAPRRRPIRMQTPASSRANPPWRR